MKTKTIPRRPGSWLLAVLLWPSVFPASAVQTRTTEADPADLLRGDADGIAITTSGSLLPAPRLVRLDPGGERGGPAQVWAATTDGKGGLFLGTGPEGAIVRVSAAGESRVFYRTPEPLVTALALLSGGDLLAGTSPGGNIYRIRPDGSGSVWCRTGERYVWSLAASEDGTVFAGTGERGVVQKIGAAGSAEALFDSDEAHIVSLALVGRGEILAGSAGRGLVYRIDPRGRAQILHDDALPEIRAVVPAADGAVFAAALGEPETDPRLPAVRIQVAGAPEIGAAPDLSAEYDDRRGSTLEGIIEGLPPHPAEMGRRVRGRILRIAADGTEEEIWRSTTEVPYCLALDPRGRAVFGVGEPGRLYRSEGPGEVALLATLVEGQVTALSGEHGALAIATSNPAAAYRLETDSAAPGTFVSRPLDAGTLARWGSVRWQPEGPRGRVEVYTRTGNTAEPDETWSAWSPALVDPESSRVPNPDGRFVQWRARIAGGEDSGARVSGISIHYTPFNRPPGVRDLLLEAPRRSLAGKATFQFEASDADGDVLDIELQHRSGHGSPWDTGARLEGFRTGAPAPGTDELDWKEGKVSWDTASVPEGTYEVRVLASDRAVNVVEEGREATIDLRFPVTIDRTPPEIDANRADGGAVEIRVRDARSPVNRLELLRDGKPAFLVAPVDGVCDSADESFALEPEALESAAAGGRAVLVRALDDAGNTAEKPLREP